jgi:hypothetical protein
VVVLNRNKVEKMVKYTLKLSQFFQVTNNEALKTKTGTVTTHFELEKNCNKKRLISGEIGFIHL